MQVAPSSPRAAKLREADLRKLLGTLSALLEQSPGRAARLVVFDLEQQKVLFRKDEFTQADFQNLAKLIDERPSGVVDYAALENSRGEADMLTRLIETERCELGASDALVFLGLHMQQPPRGSSHLQSDPSRRSESKCRPAPGQIVVTRTMSFKLSPTMVLNATSTPRLFSFSVR